MSPSSYTLALGATAPNFNLKSTDGNFYILNDFVNFSTLVIFFTCNHCPYVINSDEITRKTAEKFKDQGVGFVGINSNSDVTYPEDSYENMILRMKNNHFPWVYLRDDKQTAALAFGALKTPHFFVFDKNRHLIYTGRGVDSPRDPSKMKINDLENALEDHLANQPLRVQLTNPIGCNIKWNGKDKHWMPDAACDLV